jgi:hypothetical protein
MGMRRGVQAAAASESKAASAVRYDALGATFESERGTVSCRSEPEHQ